MKLCIKFGLLGAVMGAASTPFTLLSLIGTPIRPFTFLLNFIEEFFWDKVLGFLLPLFPECSYDDGTFCVFLLIPVFSILFGFILGVLIGLLVKMLQQRDNDKGTAQTGREVTQIIGAVPVRAKLRVFACQMFRSHFRRLKTPVHFGITKYSLKGGLIGIAFCIFIIILAVINTTFEGGALVLIISILSVSSLTFFVLTKIHLFIRRNAKLKNNYKYYYISLVPTILYLIALLLAIILPSLSPNSNSGILMNLGFFYLIPAIIVNKFFSDSLLVVLAGFIFFYYCIGAFYGWIIRKTLF